MTTAHDLLTGDPFGRVSPPKPEAPLPAISGRTVALRILQQYIAELRFSRPAPGGRVHVFHIPDEDIHIEQPGQHDLKFPSIVFRPGEGRYDLIGLGAYLDESTTDVYAPGTCVQEQSEYIETITIECWAETGPQRDAIVAGLEKALAPIEQYYGLRFHMPDYFERTVCFSLLSGSRPDDAEASKNRRWALLNVEMRFNVVALVNVVSIEPIYTLDVDGAVTTTYAPAMEEPEPTDEFGVDSFGGFGA
jgi:hypothetical protein